MSSELMTRLVSFSNTADPLTSHCVVGMGKPDTVHVNMTSSVVTTITFESGTSIVGATANRTTPYVCI